LSSALTETRQLVAQTFDPPGNMHARDAVLDLWTERPVMPPTELVEFAEDKVLQAIARASDRQLLHFLGWNNASLEPSSAHLQRNYEDFSHSFMVEAEDMIEAGQIPPESLGALVRSYQRDKQLCALDAFTSARLNCNGLLSPAGMIGIAEGIILGGKQRFYDTCAHEMFHDVERTIGVHLDANLATAESGSNMWLRDGFIEHMVQTAVLTVEWEDPEQVAPESTLYLEERKLLGAISKVGQIPMRCFADTFMGVSTSNLPYLISESFRGSHTNSQPNLVAAISHDYNRAATRAQQIAVVNEWQSRVMYG